MGCVPIPTRHTEAHQELGQGGQVSPAVPLPDLNMGGLGEEDQ